MSLATTFPPPVSKAPHTEQEWPPQGKWTYEDYRRLPDDGWRYEVIQGELYMTPAPLTIHQRCKGNAFAALWNFNEQNDKGIVLDAPYDVILSDLASPVQPDVLFVVKDRMHIVKEEHVEGAPDLIIEILSPSNWFVDRRKKFEIYAKAGVREYWIIDPAARTIELFALHGSRYELRGKFGIGETVHSEVLPSFAVKVEDICPA